ncbi:hypothetical protein BDV59DRAFT_66415 [Aspergillus ambiguus]|uniref:uncharacterized protein n=1 Tax=Aspergillus ambiguus TaxID=176160 RepID=UPI003CCE1F3A
MTASEYLSNKQSNKLRASNRTHTRTFSVQFIYTNPSNNRRVTNASVCKTPTTSTSTPHHLQPPSSTLRLKHGTQLCQMGNRAPRIFIQHIETSTDSTSIFIATKRFRNVNDLQNPCMLRMGLRVLRLLIQGSPFSPISTSDYGDAIPCLNYSDMVLFAPESPAILIGSERSDLLQGRCQKCGLRVDVVCTRVAFFTGWFTTRLA